MPIFINIFEVGVIKEQNKKGPSYVPTFDLSVGEHPTEEEYALLVELREEIEKMSSRSTTLTHAETSSSGEII
jgi:hypothetical protein